MITIPRGFWSSRGEGPRGGSGAGMWSGIGSHVGLERGACIGGSRRRSTSPAGGGKGFVGLPVMGFPLSATRVARRSRSATFTGPILEQFPGHPSDACTFDTFIPQVADFIDERSFGFGNKYCRPATFSEVWLPRPVPPDTSALTSTTLDAA